MHYRIKYLSQLFNINFLFKTGVTYIDSKVVFDNDVDVQMRYQSINHFVRSMNA